MRNLIHPSRREFVKTSFATAAALAAFGAHGWRWPYPALAAAPDIVVAQQGAPGDLVRAAVDALGGIGRFVKAGQFVVVKPNFTWGNAPEFATDTNPDVLKAVVELCKAAGASRVLVVDHVLNGNLTNCLEVTGARKAVESAGGEILGLPAGEGQANRYADLIVTRGQLIKKAQVIKEVLAADVFINVPIAKDHTGAVLTMSLKNLMGVVLNRGTFHSGLDQAIADINTQVKSHLIILDAIRVLTTNGPQGRGKVESPGKIIAGVDPVAVDSYATGLFKLTGADISYIRRAKAAGVGESDLTKLVIQTITPGAAPPPQPAATVAPTMTPAGTIPTATVSRPGSPTVPVATAAPVLAPTVAPTVAPTATATRPALLAPVPTPSLTSGGAFDLGPAAPLAAVPVLAILAAVGWAVRRRMTGGGDGGGAS
jgi:uncharacterized protein (DUF362 family)